MGKERPFEFGSEHFKHLAAAPIVEAVLHFRARGTADISAVVLQRELQQRLSGYSERQLLLEFLNGPHEPEPTSSNTARRGVILRTGDHKQIARFFRDGLSFSRLRPYDCWNVFVAEGLNLWQTYIDLFHPLEIQQLGVRFINRIPLSDLASAPKYLATIAKGLNKFGLPISDFRYQSTHDVPSHPYRLKIVHATQPPSKESGDYGLIVDIEVNTTSALPIAGAKLESALTEMRELKDKAFFSSMTKKAIKSFEKDIV